MTKRRFFTILTGLVLLAAILFLGGYGYLHTARFGALPKGARLQKVEASPNYRDGEFRNLEPIPNMTAEKSGALRRLLTPKIGEAVPLGAEKYLFSQWWKESARPL